MREEDRLWDHLDCSHFACARMSSKLNASYRGKLDSEGKRSKPELPRPIVRPIFQEPIILKLSLLELGGRRGISYSDMMNKSQRAGG